MFSLQMTPILSTSRACLPSGFGLSLWCVVSSPTETRSPSLAPTLAPTIGELSGRLSTDGQFHWERRRQYLLDQRWRRWRSMIVTLGAVAGVTTGTIPVEKVVVALLRHNRRLIEAAGQYR